MPIYEYKCDKCGDVFEVRQKFSDEPVTIHEKCGGTVQRLISAPSFQFKGSGWYVTDYAKGGSSGGGNGSKTESKTEFKTDTKSETKSESKPASTESPKSTKTD